MEPLIYGELYGDRKGARPIPIDAVSNILINISTEHASIHYGSHYELADVIASFYLIRITNNSTGSNNITYDINYYEYAPLY